MTNDTQRIAQSDLVERPYLMTGQWELDPDGTSPGIYVDDPEGGDPICLGILRRIYHEDRLRTALSRPQPTLDREAIARAIDERDNGYRLIAERRDRMRADAIINLITKGDA